MAGILAPGHYFLASTMLLPALIATLTGMRQSVSLASLTMLSSDSESDSSASLGSIYNSDNDDIFCRIRAHGKEMQEAASVFGSVITAALHAYAAPLYSKLPYHTSALTGDAWVQELILGHPMRIQCELGVRKHVFHALVNSLRRDGFTDSRHIRLEEQLSIFLYACVTGLSTRHLGERFQHANSTISQ
jgi:hypothetical protein